MILMARPGAGERLAADDRLRQAELLPHPPHLVLEQRAQRLDQAELQVIGQPADVVVRLDVGRAGAAARLHHVRVQRALDQELAGLAVLAGLGGDLPGRALERADELPADDLALALRVGHPGQRGQERLGLVRHHEPDPGGGHEVLLHLLRLALAQQPVIDEHAGQPVANGALHERGGDRGVHPAGQPADRAAVADLLADRATCSSTMFSMVQDGRQPASSRNRLSSRVPCSVCMTSGWNWTPNMPGSGSSIAATGVAAVRAVTVKPGGAAVQVSPCDIQTRWLRGRPGQQRARRRSGVIGRAVLGRAGPLDRAAQAGDHQLEAVADAEDGHARRRAARPARAGAPSA